MLKIPHLTKYPQTISNWSVICIASNCCAATEPGIICRLSDHPLPDIDEGVPSSVCNDKAELISKILDVHKLIASIQIETSDALVSDRTKADGASQLELHRARGLRRTLMEELTKHVDVHGC